MNAVPPKDRKPNILWICTDQQRYDTIAALGNPNINTPNLDRLVREGVAFTRAYSQSPTCSPSRAAMLTGRYPRTTRVTKNGGGYFPPDEVLVTRLLADAGYDCGLAGKLHLSAAQGELEKRPDDGYRVFEWSHAPKPEAPVGHAYQDWLRSKGVDWSSSYRGVEGGIDPEHHQTTWCAEQAIRFMQERRSSPWLMSVNIFDPHPPFDPPEVYRERYRPEDMPSPRWMEGEMRNKPLHQRRDLEQGGQDGEAEAFHTVTDLQKRRTIADYYAMIELIDSRVGRMVKCLQETGQRDDTVVIFMSDHGENLWDHGFLLKGAYFYESLLHVPLIVSCPGLFGGGRRCGALVELVDLAPTLLEIAGLEVPYYMQGKSFLPLLKARGGPNDLHAHKDHVYAEFYDALLGIHEGIYATMYYDGRHKIVVYHGQEVGELYDHRDDPDEFHNLWDSRDHRELRTSLIRRCFDSVMTKVDPKPAKVKRY